MSSESPSPDTTNPNCCQKETANVWTHLKRVFLPIRASIPNARERSKLESSSKTNEALQQFCVWRRSSLMVASPSVFASMILGFINLEFYLGNDSPWNGFGKFLFVMLELSDLFLFVAVCYAATKWHQVRRSTRALRIGWTISIILPLLPAIFPLEMVVDQFVVFDLKETGDVFYVKIELALRYVLQLLPVVVTVPSSAVRAALRIRHLMPHSSLPGWILLICAPFYSLVVLIALVVVTQVAGDVLLLIGTLLLVLKPCVYLLRGSLFVGVSTPKVEKQIRTTMYVGVALGVAGIVMVTLWAFTANVGIRPIGSEKDCDREDCLLTYDQGAKILFEWIGRTLVTTVIFCDFLIAMVLKDWEHARNREDLLGPDRHTDFEALHQVLANQRTTQKDKNSSNPSTLEDTSKTYKDPELGTGIPHDASLEAGKQQQEDVPKLTTDTPSSVPAPSPTLGDMEES